MGIGVTNGALLAPKGIVMKSTLAMARTPTAVMGVEDVASKCIEEGCPVDLLDDLLDELKAESSALTKRQQTLLILIGRLQALAGMDNPEKAKSRKSCWLLRGLSRSSIILLSRARRLATVLSLPKAMKTSELSRALPLCRWLAKELSIDMQSV